MTMSGSVFATFGVQTGYQLDLGWEPAVCGMRYTMMKQRACLDFAGVVTGPMAVTEGILSFSAVKCKSQPSRHQRRERMVMV